ncbi:MAG: hypothetical protein AVDCRST_MAG45-699, partial [uncultured Solirubrobacterales bacterium]
ATGSRLAQWLSRRPRRSADRAQEGPAGVDGQGAGGPVRAHAQRAPAAPRLAGVGGAGAPSARGARGRGARPRVRADRRRRGALPAGVCRRAGRRPRGGARDRGSRRSAPRAGPAVGRPGRGRGGAAGRAAAAGARAAGGRAALVAGLHGRVDRAGRGRRGDPRAPLRDPRRGRALSRGVRGRAGADGAAAGCPGRADRTHPRGLLPLRVHGARPCVRRRPGPPPRGAEGVRLPRRRRERGDPDIRGPRAVSRAHDDRPSTVHVRVPPGCAPGAGM